MQVSFRCPQCQCPSRQGVTEGGALSCGQCEWSRVIPQDDVAAGQPRRCVVCGNADLWRQKDFPQGVGLLIVAAGILASSIAVYYYRPILALSILMAFALADLLLFALMPDVLVCYRCHARHAGCDVADRAGFDHELAERYRQERLRLQGSGKLHDSLETTARRRQH